MKNSYKEERQRLDLKVRRIIHSRKLWQGIDRAIGFLVLKNSILNVVTNMGESF
jgi:hypothetical protein